MEEIRFALMIVSVLVILVLCEIVENTRMSNQKK
jgi:hypothetical protein